mgnify:CR=1 FL=1
MYCKNLGASLADLGFPKDDPRVYRNMNMALNVYETALDKKRAKSDAKRYKKSEKKGHTPDWDRDNPDASKLLRWASRQADDQGELNRDEMLVRIEIPQRPENAV